MGWTEDELQKLDFDDPTVIEQVLRAAPLGRARPDRVLSSDHPVNSYYTEAMNTFRRKVTEAIVGEPTGDLSAEMWQQIKAAFAAHEAWVNSEPAHALEAIGREKLQG